MPRLLFLPLLALTACERWPESYPPPAQREPLPGTQTRLQAFVHMNDPQVEAYLVRDVSPHLESGTWRWTYGRPELRFHVPRAGRQQFAMDFALPDAVWRQTGAVTLTILVNDVVLERLALDRPGPRQYRKAVPPGMLKAGALNRVVIEQDKVFTAPEDGAKLGFILNSAGFLE